MQLYFYPTYNKSIKISCNKQNYLISYILNYYIALDFNDNKYITQPIQIKFWVLTIETNYYNELIKQR